MLMRKNSSSVPVSRRTVLSTQVSTNQTVKPPPAMR